MATKCIQINLTCRVDVLVCFHAAELGLPVVPKHCVLGSVVAVLILAVSSTLCQPHLVGVVVTRGAYIVHAAHFEARRVSVRFVPLGQVLPHGLVLLHVAAHEGKSVVNLKHELQVHLHELEEASVALKNFAEVVVQHKGHPLLKQGVSVVGRLQ